MTARQLSTTVAIITGGLTGIGLACARSLQKQGHPIAVGSRRGMSDENLEKSARETLGKDALIGQLDVTDEASIEAFIAETTKAFGAPSILVNAHGIAKVEKILQHSDTTWFDQIDINLNGVFRMIRAVYPHMLNQNHGRIVNIASTAAHVGAKGYAAYCASKAGLVGLTKAIAVEGAPHNITCLSVSPTFIETPMMDHALKRIAKKIGKSEAQMKETLREANPQQRLVQPEEVGELVAFCCSDAAPALTNEDIQVNAGAQW